MPESVESASFDSERIQHRPELRPHNFIGTVRALATIREQPPLRVLMPAFEMIFEDGSESFRHRHRLPTGFALNGLDAATVNRTPDEDEPRNKVEVFDLQAEKLP